GQFRSPGLGNGTLNAQTDGADYAQGTLTFAGGAQYPFEAVWSAAGIRLQYYELINNQYYVYEIFLEPGSSPPPPVGDVQYHIFSGNQQTGPLSLQQVRERIAAGTLQGTDLIWRAG